MFFFQRTKHKESKMKGKKSSFVDETLQTRIRTSLIKVLC